MNRKPDSIFHNERTEITGSCDSNKHAKLGVLKQLKRAFSIVRELAVSAHLDGICWVRHTADARLGDCGGYIRVNVF